MRLAEPARRPVRPVALAGVGAGRPGAPDDDPAAAAESETAEQQATEAPVAEPALALVGGAQPARSGARATGAVCLAA
jgi:hypothetical protein